MLIASLYFIPIITLLYLACGALDVSRHRKIRAELLEKYFMGSGLGTWLLSPINLLADLLSHRNKGVHRIEDLPAEYRSEIESCVQAFVENGARIKGHIAKALEKNKRCMLTFKWYGATQELDLRIPAFERDYRYVKTIAVSAFNARERTSWHFGPLRFTFRALYNLEPIDSPDVFIEVDDQIHYWRNNPLFIFDDTLFHRSINDVECARYCLFIDIVRPNYFQSLFSGLIVISSAVASSFKRVFYKNWSFIR